MSLNLVPAVSNFYPAVALALGFPLLMLTLNELIIAGERRELALVRTLRTARNLVVPSLALLIFARFVLEFSTDSTTVRLLATVFWVFALYTALGVINDIVFGSASAESWRARLPQLFADLARVVLVAIGAMVIYSYVWGQEIQGALTALGVGSVVIGLALQEPLGNIVSGLMLLFERPLKVGDWISAEGVTGKVIEINWRSVHIQTSTRELRIVPNVRLYKGAFSNLSRPTDVRTEVIQLGFSYDDPPNKVKEVLTELISNTEGVLSDPAPSVRTVEYADWSINYRLSFSVARQEDLAATRDRFMTRLWYAIKREGLSIPFPIQMEYSPGETPGVPSRAPGDWLKDFPRFKAAVKADSAHQPRILDYAAGEIVQSPAQRFSGFALILQGKASLLASDKSGQLSQIAEMGPGECFGDQLSSSSTTSELSILATQDLKLLLFDNNTMSEVLNQSPTLAAEIGDSIESRRNAALALRLGRSQ